MSIPCTMINHCVKTAGIALLHHWALLPWLCWVKKIEKNHIPSTAVLVKLQRAAHNLSKDYGISVVVALGILGVRRCGP